MILHIPHSSRKIPDQYRSQVVLSEFDLSHELTLLTDAFTDELFNLPGAKRVVFPISRLLVDVERFPDDDQEPMSKVGMGIIYLKTVNGRSLKRPLLPDEMNRLKSEYYVGHHRQLRDCVESELGQSGSALIVDCHSFPSTPLPCHLDQSPETPDFCIGTDSFHTPPTLVKRLSAALEAMGHSFGVDRPFSGSIVPMEFYRLDHRVASIMIEVNRRLYMDESTGAKVETFDDTRAKVRTLLVALSDFQQRA